jgi:hypothetical protein
MTIQIINCHVLSVVKLPQRGHYPECHIASLLQEQTHKQFNVVCTEECFDALEMTDRDTAVTVEARARQIDLGALGSSGKAYKLLAMRCIREESSPALRSQAAAEDKQAPELPDGDGASGPVYKTTRRPR